MATVAETNALLAQYDALVLGALPKLSSLTDQMAAISPTDPNAASTLKSLESQYQSVKSQTEAQMKVAYAKYSAAYDSLTPAQQQQANNSTETKRHEQVAKDAAANKARHDSVYSSKTDEIQKAGPAPTVPGTGAPAENGVTPGTATSTPNTNTAANDDSGAKQSNPAGSTGGPPSAIAAAEDQIANDTPLNSVDLTEPGAPGSTATPALRTEASKTQPPGKRLKNPLGYLSSYTYQISLYMITPKAYDAFVQSGRKNIGALSSVTGGAEGGAWLIAQSGGINNAQEDRAPGFGFDYSIDNLSFSTAVSSTKAGEGDTNTSIIKFTITEPYGFSFITNLKKAQAALEKYAGTENIYLSKNPMKQFFVLGVRFYGYDERGQIVKGDEVYDGATLDPTAPGTGAIFQRFYDIVLNEVKFKIDGKAVIYNIGAASLPPTQAFGLKRGQVNTNINIEASNVEEAINQLISNLNQREQELYKNSKHPDLYNTYKVKYLGEASTVIAKAKIVSPADLDKFKWPGSGATNTAQTNDQTAANNSTPDNTKTQITISGSPKPTPIPAAINTIITRSQFLEQGLKTVYTTSLEPPKGKTKMNQVDQGTKKVLKWFNISSELSNARWNPETSDWVYDITYLIQTYETPVLDSAYANVTTKYYGCHKRYDYWYSGKNSEIISYTMELNNSYFTVTVAPTKGNETASTENPSTDGSSTGETGNATKGSPAETPTTPGISQNQSTEGKVGGAGKEAQNNFITSLYDPAAQAEAKITILGDPDFMIIDSSYSEEQLYKKFYGPDGFSINPNGGQVFIEIDFKEAVDYSSDGSSIDSPGGGAGISGEPGTLSINESILFWKYPEDISKLVKGISYQVKTVVSQFNNGSFKQTLECVINTFAQASKPASGAGREPAANNSTQPAGTTPAAGTNTATGKSPSASNATNADSGLKGEPPAKTSTTQQVIAPSTALPNPNDIVVTASASRVVPTTSGFVADDDASGIQVNKNILNSVSADAGRETNLLSNLSPRTTLLTPTINPNATPAITGP